MKVNIDFDGMKVSRTQKLKDVRVIAYEGNILTDDLKEALLQLASKVAYIDDQGQQYYDDLYDALYPSIPATSVVLSASTLNFYTLNTTQTLTATVYPDGSSDTVTWSSSNTSVATVSDGVVTALTYGTATITATAGSVSATCSILVAQASLVSISADYTQSGTVYSTDSLDSLKSDLVVKAQWSDSSESTLQSSDYTLSGTLTAGTSTITVTYVDKTATFTVTVTENTVSSISAVFTQGSAVIYPDDSLDTLKQYLVVTATYSDTSSATVPSTDYTLSGTLTAGTSTITATYGGKTDTFTVTVTQATQHYAIVNDLTNVQSSNPTVTVDENDSFSTSLGVATGYTMTSVTVTMGGVDVTSTVYNPSTRQIVISAVTGNVVITAVAENLLHYWNFKESVDDVVSGNTPTVSGATRDSSGAHFTGLTDNINLGTVIGLNKTFVIKLGTTVRNSSTWTNAGTTGLNGIMFWTATGTPGHYGFGWNKAKQSMGYYTNGYSTDGTTVTSRSPGDWEQFTTFNGTDMLSNATLKFTIDSNGVVHSYINGTEYKPVNEHTSASVYVAYPNEASCQNLVLGSPNSSYPVFRDMTIETVKVYQGVV